MIKTISLKNFRGQKEITFHFGHGLNYLIGPNEAGKTTIGHAIAFAFYGVDLTGSNRGLDHLVAIGQDRAEAILVTDKATFHRTKKRGDSSKIRLSLNSMPMIDADQTSLTQKLGISPEVFCSCFAVGYFMRLSNEKRMDVIGQIVQVDRAALLKKLLPDPSIPFPRSVKLQNPRQDAHNVTTERRKKQNELSADNGALAQVEMSLREMEGGPVTSSVEYLQAEISKLRAQAELFDIYHQEVQYFRVAQARAKDVEEANKRKIADKQKLETEMRALGAEPNLQELALIEQELSTMKAEVDKYIKDNQKPTPSAPSLPEVHDETTCMRCGQVVSEKMKASIIAEREAMINSYNELARKTADHNQEVTRTWELMTKQYNHKYNEWKSKQSAAELWRSKHVLLNDRMRDLTVVEVVQPLPPTKPDGDEQSIRTRLQDLMAQRYAVQQMTAKQEMATKRKIELVVSVAKKSQEVSALKIFESALNRLPEAEVRTILSSLVMDDVQVALVDGSLSVSDRQDVPYECLSSGRQMKVDLQIARTFQRLLGRRAPGFYFIDDYDLLDGDAQKYFHEGAQIFVAKVSSELTSLQVISS